MNNITQTELRTIYFYEWKLDHKVSDAVRNINSAFGLHATNKKTIGRWYKKFNSNDYSREIADRGRPVTTVDDGDLKAKVEENPRQTVRDLAKVFGVSAMTISRHLKSIGKVKKLDKWVPHSLNNFQKFQRMEICNSLLIRNNTCPFLHRIVTCDEKWVLYNNQRRSAQWLNVGESPRHMSKPDLHQKKIMITVWWSMGGVIHFSFLDPGETITADKYCTELEEMHRKLIIKHPAMTNRHGVILLHDNARPHISKVTLNKLKDLKYETLPHPAYSPDLAPTDYHLFKHLDHFFSNKTFTNREGVQNALSDFLDSKDTSFYESGIRNLVIQWQKCVDSDGAYFD